MKNYNSYQSVSTSINAIDLIKIANQLLQNNMQYVNISIVSSNNEDIDGSVQIHAIPSASSDEVKKYPLIKYNSSIDFSDIII